MNVSLNQPSTPMPSAVRARKAGKKIPIAIPANSGPFLMTAGLLWLLVACDPTVGNPAQSSIRARRVLAIFHSRHCEIYFPTFFERRRRARIDAENGHRRVTRPRLRIILKETRGYPTGYLRAPSNTLKCDLEQHGPNQERDKNGAVYGFMPYVMRDNYMFILFSEL